MNNLTIEDLKTIKLALAKYPLSTGLMGTIAKIDDALATHNIKAEWVSLPKRKYQRETRGEYQFIAINK